MQTLVESISPPATGRALRAILRATFAIAAIAVVGFAALAGRYLAYEYGHGNGGTVPRLFNRLP